MGIYTCYVGVMENGNYYNGLYRVFIGILEKDMEAIVMGYTDYGLNFDGGGGLQGTIWAIGGPIKGYAKKLIQISYRDYYKDPFLHS